jgi:hypothetical protein
MKRELDLIRQILLEVEQNDDYLRSVEIRAEGYSPEQINYHVMLLMEAGYVVGSHSLGPRDRYLYHPKSLTWEGHEFLDATRSGQVWHQIKAKLKDQGIDAPISVVKQLALKLTAKALLDVDAD